MDTKGIADLINWILLIVLIIIGWNKFTPSMFAARKTRIDTALSDASEAKKQGEQFLAEQRSKVANAEAETARMLAEAKQLASELEQQMKEQTKKEIADLQKRIETQIAGERQLAVTELRAAAARSSIKLTEQILPSLMTTEAKSKLLSQFMEQLDVNSQDSTTMSAGQLERTH